jgi:hypothetical protein
VVANRFSGLGSDCIDYSDVQGGRLAHNQCYRAKMIGAEHPDGFQGVKGATPNNDITVERNKFIGSMQAVDFEISSAGRNIVGRDNDIQSTSTMACWSTARFQRSSPATA